MKNIVKTYIANIVATNVAFGIIRALLCKKESGLKWAIHKPVSECEMNKIL